MPKNEAKTVSANSIGIVVSFTDINKHRYIPYSKAVREKQLHPNPKYQQTTSVLNSIQKKMYDQCLYGLNQYSQEEIIKLSYKEKRKTLLTHPTLPPADPGGKATTMRSFAQELTTISTLQNLKQSANNQP